ncbi:MAG: DUF5666 domain-containing protein [Cyanobacteria bacterium P01_A01_bin.135]
MNRLALSGLIAAGIAAVALPHVSHAQDTYTGTAERVWEDGFRLNIGDRTFRVDSWEVYGDNTPQFVTEGDRVTVTGEFSGGEFDAFKIDGNAIPGTDAPSPAATLPRAEAAGYTGMVEGVWEDGFRLNTGDRTFRVDSWEVYGDNTPQFVTEGDRVTVTGEFSDGEFDAFTVTGTGQN